MADDNNEVKDELPRCSTLFLSKDGSQMQFYMTPCAMKTRLRPLIHNGGGQLSSKVSTDSIKLAVPGTVSNLSGYFSTEYIFDSIKHNKLQDMTNYRITSQIERKLEVENSEGKMKVRKRNGRIAYTPEEDLALLDFVNEYFTCYPIGGNALYKKAEKQKVTTHTWQSMRDHYLKVLHPKTKIDKRYSQLSLWTRGGKNSSGFKGNENKKHDRQKKTEKKSSITEERDARITRAQAARMKEENEKDEGTVKEDKENEEGDEKTDGNGEEKVDTSHEDTDETDSEAKNAVTTENFPDVESTAEVSSAGEDVDYDKQFDDNLLLIAYKSKQRPCVNHVWESSEDENKTEEKEVSSSQDTDSSVVTRRRKKLSGKKDKMSDFDGEVIFRKSPSVRKGPSDDEDEKRPLAKRSKMTTEFPPDHENGSRGKEAKEMEAHLHFYQQMRSNIEKMQSKNMTVPQIIHTLLVSSGDFGDAENYLKEGKEQWTPQEDKILLSKDKTGITSLAKKRGLQAVVDRMNFMEGTS